MMDEIFRQEPGCEIGSDSSGLLKWGSTHAGYDGLLGLWQIFARQLSWFFPLCPLAFYPNLKKILEGSLIVVVNFKKAQCIQSYLRTSLYSKSCFTFKTCKPA